MKLLTEARAAFPGVGFDVIDAGHVRAQVVVRVDPDKPGVQASLDVYRRAERGASREVAFEVAGFRARVTARGTSVADAYREAVMVVASFALRDRAARGSD